MSLTSTLSTRSETFAETKSNTGIEFRAVYAYINKLMQKITRKGIAVYNTCV